MRPGLRAGESVSARSLLHLGIALSLAVAPLALFVPTWLPAWVLAMTVWRVFKAWRAGTVPTQWIRLVLFFLGVGAVLLSYRSFLSVDAAVALLCVLIGLKLAEVRTLRDYLVTVFVGYFVLLAGFFYDQSLAMLCYAAVPAVLLLGAAAQATSGRMGPMRWWPAVRVAASLLAISAPLTLILFLFFPRLETPFTMRLGQSRTGITGMSDLLEPGGVSQMATSDAVAFRAEFPDGFVPEPSDRYWRGLVLTRCDGLVWRRGRERKALSLVGKNRGKTIRQRITIEPHQQLWLFALDRPVAAPQDLMLWRDQTLSSPNRIERSQLYGVLSAMDYQWQHVDDSEAPELLDVKAPVDPRIRKLAEGWAKEGGGDPERIADLALSFFSQGFVYSMSPGSYSGSGALAEFLFERRKGFCEHYAASFATLMRLAGVRSRVVLGYQGGTLNRHGMYLTVRQYDAHSWAEIWTEKAGWRRVDPTARVAPDRLEFGMESFARATGGAFESDAGARRLRIQAQEGEWAGAVLREARELWDNLDHQWNQFVLQFDSDQQSAFARSFGIPEGAERDFLNTLLGGGILVTAGGAVFWALRSGRKREPLTVAAEKFCSLLEPMNGPRESWEPLTYYAERASVKLSPAAAEVVREHARLHASERFGRKRPDSQRVRRHLARVSAELGFLGRGRGVRSASRRFVLWLLIAIAGSVSLCGGLGAGIARADVPEAPAKPTGRVEVKETITVRRTLNLEGKVWVWTGKKAKGQKEGQPPMFRIVGKGAGIRDGQIEGAPDGVHIDGKGGYLDRVVFRSVVEDAITIRADKALIKNCWFFGAEDKVVQHNDGTDAIVEKNVFVDCAKAYRLPDHPSKNVDAVFRGNLIYGRGQVHTESSKVNLRVEDNVWYGVRQPIFNKGSRVTQKRNRFLWLWEAAPPIPTSNGEIRQAY